jgi:hypothetical protein
MNNFIDNTARILATPALPRRQALKRIGCAILGGGILGFLSGCSINCLGNQTYCANTNTCCPSGYNLNCGGACYMGASGGCPSNLVQDSLCS